MDTYDESQMSKDRRRVRERKLQTERERGKVIARVRVRRRETETGKPEKADQPNQHLLPFSPIERVIARVVER